MPIVCSAMLCLPGFAGGANGIDGKAVLLPVAAESLSPSLSPSEIIPVTGSFPGMSAAIAGTTPAKLPSLPQGDAGATLAGGLYEAFKRQGESMLTPHGAADTLRGVESGGIAGLGGSLAQSVIDAGLQRIEQQAGHHFFRTLNLNWTPGFNGREDLYQIDAMLSLHDGERGSLMTQLGLQGRNGEAGANAGLVLRTRAFADWMLGLNVFYDYLSDPEVDRWSAGMELKGRWLGISSNIYIGMDEEISGSETMYSPDGWDVELSGHAPELPWLEYSGRYYKWNGELSPDLEGQDYRLTLRPVPMFDLSLRYDNAQDGDSGFGIETQLKYEFGRSMSEQLSYQRVATPASSWARRFERVRREYEQRVQRRSSAVTTSVIRLTVTSSGVVAQIGNIPAGATQVVVSGGTGLGNSLTRAAPGAPAVRVHGGNCHVVGITNATCTFTESSGEITIANLQPGSYNFSASFQDAAGVTLGGPVQFTATITATITGPTASLAVDNTAIAEAGGTATVTVTLDPAPTTAVTVNLTRSGTATIVTDYSQSGLTAATDPAYSIMVPASAATASFTLTAVNDTMVDAAETAIFTIASVTGYTAAAGGAAAVTVTITDDDGTPALPTASLAVSSTTIAEADTSSATVTVTLDPAPATAVTVNLTRSGTATIGAGNDYTATNLGGTDPTYSIMVTASTATASFTLTAVDDSDDDNSETATFMVTTGTGYTPASGSAAAVTVSITDNDGVPPPVASVHIGTAGTQTGTIAEDGTTNTMVTVTLSAAAPSGGVTVSLTRSGSATIVTDYTVGSLSGTTPNYSIMIAESATTATFTLTAVDDTIDDDDETAVFTVMPGPGYTPASGGAEAVTVTITDDDDPPVASVHIGNAGTQTGTIAEAGTTSTTVTVSLSTAANTEGVVVSLTRSGMATIATDYSQTGLTDSTDPAYSIMVAAGATTASFMLTAVRDTENDTAETAVFTVTTGTGYTPATGGAEAVTISITDDADPPGPVTGLAATPGNDQVALSWTNPSDTDLSTVIISAMITGGAVVDINGAGTAGNALSISATPGSMGSQTITGLSNGTGYTFSLVASDGTNSSTPVTTTATPAVPIPEFSFQTAAATAAEGGSFGVNIAFTGGALASSTSLNISLGGTAMAADYIIGSSSATYAGTTLSITAGRTSPAGFVISPAPDVLTEGDETLIITLLASNDGSYTLGANNTYTLTITDVPPPEVSFPTATATVAEGGNITVELAFTGPALVSLINLNVSLGGTAEAVDYSTAPGIATPLFSTSGLAIFAGTVSPANFMIFATTDADGSEGSETLIITLEASTDGAYTLGANNTYTLTITDPAPPPVASIHIGTAGTQVGTIAEAGTTSTTVTVSLSAAAPTGGVVVSLTRSGSATIGTGFDYSQSGLTDSTDPAYSIMVAAGATTASFTLTAVRDTENDTAETAVFTVTTGTGYTVAAGGAEAVTISITDDADPPGPVTFLAATPGNDQVTLSWFNPSAADLSTVIISAIVTGGAVVDINGAGAGNDLSISATPSSMGSQSITGLSNGTGYTFSLVASDGTNSSTPVTITATPVVPPPEFSFPTAMATGAEGGTITVNIAFTGGALASSTSLNVSLGGDAMRVLDYTTVNRSAFPTNNLGGANPDILIPAGETSPVSFEIKPAPDVLTEGDETLIITLLEGDGYTVDSANNTYTLTITDVPPPEFSFQTAAATVAEGGNITVELAFTGGVTSAINFNVIVGGTAMAADYSTAPGTLFPRFPAAMDMAIFAGTVSPANFMIFATTDADGSEGSETLIITLAASTDGAYTLGANPTYTLTITDPAPPPVASIHIGTAGTQVGTIAEAGTTSTMVTVSLSAAAPTGGVVVSLTRSGSATIATDYSQSGLTDSTDPAYSIMVAAGATTASFTLTAVRDTENDAAETAVFTVTPGTGYTVAAGGAAAATVTILDDSDTTPPTVMLTGAPTTVNASTATFAVTATFSEPVTGFDEAADITVTNGTAAAPVFVSEGIYTLIITPSGTDGAITITIPADAATDAATNGNTASSAVTVTYDNAPPTATFTGTDSVSNTDEFRGVILTFSEGIFGLGGDDFMVTNGEFVRLEGVTVNRAFELIIKPDGVGDIIITLMAGAVRDLAVGNANIATSHTVTYTAPVVDAPMVFLRDVPATVSNLLPFEVLALFDEGVGGFDSVDDIMVTNGTAIAPMGFGSETDFTLTITPDGMGDIVIFIPAGAAIGANGNGNPMSSTVTVAYVPDNTPPTVTFTAPASHDGTSTFTVAVTLSETATDFVTGDIALSTNASGMLTGSGTDYRLTIIPADNNPITIDIAAGSFTDAATNGNTAPETLTVTYDAMADTTPPTATFSDVPASHDGMTTFTLTITLSEPSTDFVVGDFFTTTNVNIALSGSGTDYSLTVTPTSIGVIAISINPNVFTDAANNGNLTADSGFISYVAPPDTTPPTVMLSGAPTIANASDTTFAVMATFSEAVTGFDAMADITVTGGTAIAPVAVGNSGTTYTLTITPTTDGTITITIPANVAVDAASNDNMASNTVSVTYDGTPPTIALTGEGRTFNTLTFTAVSVFGTSPDINHASFTSDEWVTTPANVMVTSAPGPTGFRLGTVYSIMHDGTASQITITAPIGSFTDNAGNPNTEAFTFTFTYVDNTPPTVTYSGVPASHDGMTPFMVTVTLSEPSSNLAVGDITQTNANRTLSGSGTDYIVTVTPRNTNPIAIAILADSFTDAAGNGNTAAFAAPIPYVAPADTTPPTARFSNFPANHDGMTPFTVTVILSEPATDFFVSDVAISDNASGTFFGSGTGYRLTITPTDNNPITFDIAAGTFTDAATNPNTAPEPLTVAYAAPADTTPPTATFSGVPASHDGMTPFTVTITLSEPSDDFVVGDFSTTLDANIALSGSGTDYSLTVTPIGTGIIATSLNPNVFTDAANNGNLEASTGFIPYAAPADTTPPTVELTGAPTTANAGDTTFAVTATFSEAVTGFDEAADITVTGGTAIAPVAVGNSETIYTLTITPTTDGTITITIPANVAADASSNDNTASNTVSVTYDGTPPTATFSDVPASHDGMTPFTLTITLSEPSDDFVVSDISTPLNTNIALSGSATDYSLTVTPSGTGIMIITLNPNVFTDAANNGNLLAGSGLIPYAAPPPPPVASVHIGTAGIQTGTIAEAGTTSTTVTVALNPAPTTSVTVLLNRSSTATIATDYSQTGLTDSTDPAYSIMVAAGATTASFMLTAVDDSVNDDGEAAVFTVTTGTGYTIAAGGAAVVTVTITDNDAPPVASIYIGTAGTQVGTIAEAGTTSTTVTVALNPVSTTFVTVFLDRSGSATIATDYSQTGLSAAGGSRHIITLAAGATTGSFTLTAVDDSADDDNETAVFTVVTTGTGYTPASGGAAAVTVTITDNDDPPVASIHIGTAGTQVDTIAEAGTTSTMVTVSLSAAAPTGGLLVSLTRSGMATIATDYSQTGLTAGTNPAYSIMVAAGATTASFTLTAVRDTENDAAETAVFTVTTGTGYTIATGGAEAVTISITDDADPPIPVAELVATPGNDQVTLSWHNSLSADISTVIISAMITGGAVVDINGADAGNDLSISTTPGSRRDSQTITGLSNGTGYTFSLVASDGTNRSTPVTITATPAVLPEFSFQTAMATGAEGAGTITVNIAFTGVASIASDAFLDVSLGGTAEAADYRAASSTATVNFDRSLPFLFIDAGRTSPVSFTITPATDALTEGDETLVITLLPSTNGTYTLGANNTYTLTITDVP